MNPSRPTCCPARRGAAIIYGVVVMAVLLALCSLAVDYGKAQLVRTELQGIADGAARAAASGLAEGVGEAQQRARTLGALSRADNEPVAFADSDFRFGTWDADAGRLDPDGTPVDAVEVTARREVALVFGAMFGRSSVSVSARAIARAAAPTSYALVGLDGVTMDGDAEVDSFDSTAGPYLPANRRADAAIGTNGDLALRGSVKLYGNATYRGQFTTSGQGEVIAPGQASKVTSTLSFTPPTLPATYSSMGPLNGIGNNSLTLTSGNYHFTSFSAAGSFQLNIVGEVSIYVDESFTLAGRMTVLGNKPGNFRVYVLGDGDVTIGGTSALYADVYAPLSPVTLTGTGDLYGRFVGRSMTANGRGNIHFDESLPTSSGGTIALVR